MRRVITGGQADMLTTHIPIGIIGSGRAATGAIAKAFRDVGLPEVGGSAFASQSPRNLRSEISLPQSK
jgi:hypothetical protein